MGVALPVAPAVAASKPAEGYPNRLQKTVQNDESETIGNNRSIEVSNDHTEAIGGSMSLSVSKERSVEITAKDGYAELFIPILQDVGIKSLNLDIGGRYSSYNAAPSATTFKVNVDAANAAGISRHGLQASGGWSSTKVADEV